MQNDCINIKTMVKFILQQGVSYARRLRPRETLAEARLVLHSMKGVMPMSEMLLWIFILLAIALVIREIKKK